MEVGAQVRVGGDECIPRAEDRLRETVGRVRCVFCRSSEEREIGRWRLATVVGLSVMGRRVRFGTVDGEGVSGRW